MSQGMEKPKVTFGDISGGWVIFLSLGFAAPKVPPFWGGQCTASHAWRFPTHGACEGRWTGWSYQIGGHLPSRGKKEQPRSHQAVQHPDPYRCPLAFSPGPSAAGMKHGQLHRQLLLLNPCLVGVRLAAVSHCCHSRTSQGPSLGHKDQVQQHPLPSEMLGISWG